MNIGKVKVLLLILLLFPSLSLASSKTPFEKRADQAYERGEFKKAYDFYWKAVYQNWKYLGQAKKQEKAVLEASIYYLLGRIQNLDKYYTVYPQEILTKLKSLSLRDVSSPFLRRRINYIKMNAYFAMAQYEQTLKIRQKLGFITHWAILGAFENERGGGYSTFHEPEKKILLKKRYQGRKRQIYWRFTPKEMPLNGEITLSQLFLPNQQVLAYALASVYLPTTQKALLFFSSDESYKIWINGQLLDGQELERHYHFDQKGYELVLKKGWNQILVKSSQQKGEWKFSLALTNEKGEEISGLSEADSLERIELASPNKGFQLKKILLHPAEILEKKGLSLRKNKKERGAELLHQSAFLYHISSLLDRNLRKAYHLWKKAIQWKPKSLYYLFLSRVASNTSEFSVEKEENSRRIGLEKAISLNPFSALAYYELGRYYEVVLPLKEKALALYQKALSINPDLLPAVFGKNRIYEDRGWHIAKVFQLKTFHKYQSYPSVAYLYASELQDKNPEKALSLLLPIYNHAPFAFPLHPTLISIYKNIEKNKEVEKLLLQYRQFHPLKSRIYFQLADYYLGQDKASQALHWLEKYLSFNPESHTAWNEKGKIHLMLGQKQRGLQAFAMSRKVNPNQPWLQKYWEVLGKKEKSFEDDFPLSSREIVEKYRKEKGSQEDPGRILLDRTIIRVYPDGLSSEYRHLLIQITNEEGLSQYASLPVYYYVGEHKVLVKRARIYHPDGSTEESRTGSYGWDQMGSEFGWWSQVSVPFPSLKIGDIIEVQYRVDGIKPSFFGTYFGTIQYFQDEVPMEKKEFILLAPRERKLYFHQHKLNIPVQIKKGKDGLTIYRWVKTHIPKLEKEPLMPKNREVMPWLQVSTFKNWKEFGKWYWNLIKNQLHVSDGIREKVEELTKGLKSDFEKIRAVYNFVVSDIRYSSEWEFGVHGYKPYSADAIFKRKFGDCKDKAILINTMLKTIGIKAYPVLIRGEDGRSKEDLTLPMVNHFNHCISYVPPQKSLKKGFFLDGTAQYHSIDSLPTMDWGAKVVVVTPEGGKVLETPVPKAEENLYAGKYGFMLNSQGGGKLEVRFKAKKSFSVFFRSFLQNPGRRKKSLENLWGKYFGSAKVVHMKFSNLKDLNQNVEGRFILEIPKILDKEGKKFIFPRIQDPLFEFKLGQNLTDLVSKSKRTFDLILSVPTAFDLLYEIQIPKGLNPEALPSRVELKNPYGYYLYDIQRKGNTLIIRKIFLLKKGRVPAKDYPEFRKFLESIHRQEIQNIPLVERKAVE